MLGPASRWTAFELLELGDAVVRSAHPALLEMGKAAGVKAQMPNAKWEESWWTKWEEQLIASDVVLICNTQKYQEKLARR